MTDTRYQSSLLSELWSLFSFTSSAKIYDWILWSCLWSKLDFNRGSWGLVTVVKEEALVIFSACVCVSNRSTGLTGSPPGPEMLVPSPLEVSEEKKRPESFLQTNVSNLGYKRLDSLFSKCITVRIKSGTFLLGFAYSAPDIKTLLFDFAHV